MYQKKIAPKQTNKTPNQKTNPKQIKPWSMRFKTPGEAYGQGTSNDSAVLGDVWRWKTCTWKICINMPPFTVL